MKKSKRRLLWEIEIPNSSHASYLFGSIHLNRTNSNKRVDKILPYIQQCKFFCAEISLAEQPHSTNFGLQLSFEENQKLSDYIGLKKYKKAKIILAKAFNFDLDLYQHLLPLITCQALSEHALEASSKQSLDLLLWNLSSEHGLVCKGLESFAEQFRLIQTIPLSVQLKSFKDIIRNVKKFRQQNKQLLTYYDIEQIDKLYKQSKKSLGPLRKSMLFDRNEIMASRILTMSAESPHFYAIGAAHLAGKKGVLSLLKKGACKVKGLESD